MYNIIIFFISIACILVFLFINSQKIVEGAKNKGKTASKTASASASSSASASEPMSSSDKQIKEQVNKALPPLVSRALDPLINDINRTQKTTKNKLNNINKKINNFNNKVTNSIKQLDSKTQDGITKLTETQKNVLSNLSQQYNMNKIGLSSQVSDATKIIKNMNTQISDASNEAVVAKNDAQKYSDLSQRIYNDVFGASTARVVHQDNQKLKENFTQMNTIHDNLFDLEKDLISKINQFNDTYYKYIRCSSGGSQSYCATNNKTDVEVNTAATAVNDAVKALEDAYKLSPTNTGSLFESNHKEILEKAKTIDELRRSLDTKMDTIIKSKNPPNELTQQYDSTVYTGIMWSVLATSVLFYVFTEM